MNADTKNPPDRKLVGQVRVSSPDEPEPFDLKIYVHGNQVDCGRFALEGGEACRLAYLLLGAYGQIRPRQSDRLTTAEGEMINTLKPHPNGLTKKELALSLGIDENTIAKRLQRMKERGLLTLTTGNRWTVI